METLHVLLAHLSVHAPRLAKEAEKREAEKRGQDEGEARKARDRTVSEGLLQR